MWKKISQEVFFWRIFNFHLMQVLSLNLHFPCRPKAKGYSDLDDLLMCYHGDLWVWMVWSPRGAVFRCGVFVQRWGDCRDCAVKCWIVEFSFSELVPLFSSSAKKYKKYFLCGLKISHRYICIYLNNILVQTQMR